MSSPVPPDLDQGGTDLQKARVYKGPTIGWVDVVIQDTEPIHEQATILYRKDFETWAPVTIGPGLAFIDGTLVASGPPDTTRPTVTINKGASQPDPTSFGVIIFDVVFSESVIGFTASDVTVSFTCGGIPSVNMTGGPVNFTVSVTGMLAPNGNVVATILAGACTDLSGNSNFASTSVDNSVAWVAPTVTTAQTYFFIAGQY